MPNWVKWTWLSEERVKALIRSEQSRNKTPQAYYHCIHRAFFGSKNEQIMTSPRWSLGHQSPPKCHGLPLHHNKSAAVWPSLQSPQQSDTQSRKEIQTKNCPKPWLSQSRAQVSPSSSKAKISQKATVSPWSMTTSSKPTHGSNTT